MGSTLDLKENRGLQATEFALAGDVQRGRFRDYFKLHFLLEAVARNIRIHRSDHFLNGGLDVVLVG
ncbi:hypothetical protein D3C72_2418720 [compost metagenome]